MAVLCVTDCFGGASRKSVCYGTAANGRLEDGVRLPAGGRNFVSYSRIGVIAGRTYVHSRVHKAVVDAYASLEATHPEKVFMYGETGFETGGRFRPHKTHRNGLSVDFMVSVLDDANQSKSLPAWPWNKFGYGIDFDKKGRYGDLKIDFEAMAAHLAALHKAAVRAGIGIRRVIFDPGLQPYLFKTGYGKRLKQVIAFSKKRSWVRHDEHYHVDFKLRCKPLREFHGR